MTDYQREYIRKLRSNAKRGLDVFVRPKQVRPEGLNDNQWAYIQMKAEEQGLWV